MQSVKAVALLVLFAVGASEGANEEQRAAYQRHTAMLQQFPCGAPQPRVIESEKLVPKDHYAGGTVSYIQ